MEIFNSTPRLSSIDKLVILAQTDTTVGFLSQDATTLAAIKNRSPKKPFIKVYQDFRSLKKELRAPNDKKNLLRRSKKTSFILKNQAFRVAKTQQSSQLLTQRDWNYSSSANESAKSFDRVFCEQKADIIIEQKEGLFQGSASQLIKINNKKEKRLR